MSKKQGPVFIEHSCGCRVDHGIPWRCAQHALPVERRKYSIGHGLTYLECPCCGDNGAASDGEGCFYDGQALICGCPGWVSVDADGDEDAWINNGDEPCFKCEGHDGSRQ